MAVALAGLFVYGDRLGQVLFGIAALGLAAAAAHGTLIRPRLTADREGLRIRTAFGQVRLGWTEARTRLQTTRRLGRDSTTLEIDAKDHLYVFGWLELGTDPRDVLDVLSALRT
ncbi:MAG TPA: PH domain-containing protein [Amycolatopsis sp.]|nr:PH domain-containing protein [Amycolatopsis sp.]